MNRLSLLLISVGAGLAISWLPVAVNEYFFIQANRQHAQDELQQLTNHAAERAQQISRQVKITLDAVTTIQAEPCSPAFLQTVRRLLFNSPFVKDIGALQQNGIACSAVLGDVRGNRNLHLGKPEFVDYGYSVWHQPASPQAGWRENLMIGRGAWYVSVSPTTFVRLVEADRYAMAAINVDSGTVIAMSDPHAMTALLARWHGAAPDDPRIYAVARSARLRVGIVASTLRPRYVYRFRRVLPVWLTAGLITGCAAGAALFVMLSRLLFSKRRRLMRAIKRRKLGVAYQPILCLETQRCVGVEALARWNDNGVQIPPDVFVKLAEASGIVTELTRLVLDTVLTDLAEFFQRYPAFHCSINLSKPDLDPHGFLPYLRRALREQGLEAHRIRVEIIEHALLDIAAAKPAIRAFREAGHEVYLDDFGTGYSSLAYLQELELDVLKIAKPFVDAIGKDAPTSLVAPHIISMGRALGLRLIAEGVETRAQADFLAQRGVPFVQGWLFSKALSVEQLRAFLAQTHGHNRADAGTPAESVFVSL